MVQGLEARVNELEREVSTHDAGVEELNREHALQLDTLREAKAMLEVCVYVCSGWGQSECLGEGHSEYDHSSSSYKGPSERGTTSLQSALFWTSSS